MRKKRRYPMVAMRGKVILPGETANFDISRKKSMAAVEAAMAGSEKIFLVAQRDPDELEPGADGLFEYGTLCEIRQLARLPKEMGRVMVEGLTRCRLAEVIPEETMFTAAVEEAPRYQADSDDPASEAMLRVLKDKLADYAKENRVFAEKFFPRLNTLEDPETLMLRLAADLPWEWTTGQKLLECEDAEELYAVLAGEIVRETDIASIRNELQQKLREAVDKNQRDYVMREQLKLIHAELGEDEESEAEEYEEKTKSLIASEEVKAKLRKEISRMKSMPGGSQEGNVIRAWIENVLELPWDSCTEDSKDLKKAEQILDEDHYGLEKVKKRVLEHLAVRMLNPGGKGPILCLVGPPGTGKTSIAKSVARALNRKYVRISLGGVKDEAEIRGHRKTYIGAMPGRIAEGLKQAGAANPLMLLDEIDKLSSEYRGATSSALLEVLDGEQNSRFRDHYIELPIDLSRVLFFATANSLDTIPGPLLDRMEVIEISSYTENEKFHIAKDYLIAKQKKENGIPEEMLNITDSALKRIIHNYTREAGVRNAERRIGEICRSTAREILTGRKRKLTVSEKQLEKYLGKERVRFEDEIRPDDVGIVRGLAWTSVGGDTLEIEVNTMPGKGALVLTGRMGDVMKESAQTALSCVRAAADRYGVKPSFFEKHDIHIHIPEGAVPKDGPSAGITMAVAMMSACAGRKVLGTVAMTGEITLRGRILPIGGLKEKLLAANQAHMTKVLVPETNRKDVEELSPEITDGMKIVYVRNFTEALSEALEPENA